MLHDFVFTNGVLYWPPDLLRPMITSFSAWKIHYDINESKMEVAIIFWNFHSQLGFVVKEVKDVREKGESLKWACAKRLCRKGPKTLCYLCEEEKDNCWNDVCISMNESCKVESCYPIQKCCDRFRDRW